VCLGSFVRLGSVDGCGAFGWFTGSSSENVLRNINALL
jgi:hypothetical protein